MKSLHTLLVIVAIAICGLTAAIYLSSKTQTKLGDAGAPSYFDGPTMSSASISAATSTKVVSKNGVRLFLSLCNDSGNKVYLSFGQIAVATSGYVMAANTCYIMNSNPFIGQINAIASSSTSTLLIIEK